jgi:hypothetical protein
MLERGWVATNIIELELKTSIAAESDVCIVSIFWRTRKMSR